MSKPSEKEIYAKVENILINQTGVYPITPDTLIDDLEIDSLDLVEICMALEDEFGITINDQINIPRTPSELTKFVESYLDGPIGESELVKSPDLEACPFCGADAGKLIGKTDNNGYSAYVVCTNCKAQGPTVLFGSYTQERAYKAIDAWNSRKM